MIMNPTDIKLRALELALNHEGKSTPTLPAAKVVEAARVFEAYLTDKNPEPQYVVINAADEESVKRTVKRLFTNLTPMV